jgi:hypothetical protein
VSRVLSAIGISRTKPLQQRKYNYAVYIDHVNCFRVASIHITAY